MYQIVLQVAQPGSGNESAAKEKRANSSESSCALGNASSIGCRSRLSTGRSRHSGSRTRRRTRSRIGNDFGRGKSVHQLGDFALFLKPLLIENVGTKFVLDRGLAIGSSTVFLGSWSSFLRMRIRVRFLVCSAVLSDPSFILRIRTFREE